MRRKNSLRLPFYDYSQPGQYFITIVTQNRKNYFGLPEKASNQEVIFREIVEAIWTDLFDESTLSINHVLMPNHFHGIIEINEETPGDIDHLDIKQRRKMKLSLMMGKFKMQASKEINNWYQKQGAERTFKWQRNYYDRVIRNERELYNIYEYIESNPMVWEDDILNEKNYDPKKIKKFFYSL